MKKKDEIKVCLVGSSGGHLTHLYMLKPFWKDKNRFWVTFDKEDARSLLEGEKVYPCYFPTNRSIKALIFAYGDCNSFDGVFRPATEIEEMNIFTAESLNELLREAEKIMEGWTDYR